MHSVYLFSFFVLFTEHNIEDILRLATLTQERQNKSDRIKSKALRNTIYDETGVAIQPNRITILAKGQKIIQFSRNVLGKFVES